MKIKEENKGSLLREAEGAGLLSIRNSADNFLFLIETGILEHLEKEYPRSQPLKQAVDYFVFNEDLFRKKEEGESLVISISRPEEFMIGRFFLPRQITRSPALVLTRFETAVSTRNGNFLKPDQGFWFRLRMEIEGTVYPVYYCFDQMNSDDGGRKKKTFQQLFQLIIRKNIKNMKDCGIAVTRIAGDFDKQPEPAQVQDSVLMGFSLLSRSSKVHGWVIVQLPLLHLLFRSILPPWAFQFLSDNLLNRLRMLLSLSRELQSSGKMELYERPETVISSEGSIYQRIQELKLGFIKLNELLELLTPREARLLISNLLYRRGWTGEKLRELFFFSILAGYDKSQEPVYTIETLIGFNEDRFKKLLMKNMRDQWETSSLAGSDYNSGMLKHFKILQIIQEEMEAQKYFTPSTSLKTIINGEFLWYRAELEGLLTEIAGDKAYLKYQQKDIPGLNRLLTNMRFDDLVTLFRYCPEDIRYFQEIISDNLSSQLIGAVEQSSTDFDEKAVETLAFYRERIHSIIAADQKQGEE